MKRAKYIAIFLVLEAYVLAQENFQYEFGFGGGIATYTGDISRNPFSIPGFDKSVFLRSNRSSRFAFCIEYNMGKTSGNSNEINITTPNESVISPVSFTTSYKSLDFLIETSYFPYPKQKTVMNSSDITPFYFAGIGVKQYKTGNTISLPLGLGFKWKFSPNWSIQYRFKAEKLFSDNFDGDKLNDQYEFGETLKDFHRQDFLYLNTLSLVFLFGQTRWDCNCNKDQRRKKDDHPL